MSLFRKLLLHSLIKANTYELFPTSAKDNFFENNFHKVANEITNELGRKNTIRNIILYASVGLNLKFSMKATKIDEIFTVDLTLVT